MTQKASENNEKALCDLLYVARFHDMQRSGLHRETVTKP
jgi:hypothetical protein